MSPITKRRTKRRRKGRLSIWPPLPSCTSRGFPLSWTLVGPQLFRPDAQSAVFSTTSGSGPTDYYVWRPGGLRPNTIHQMYASRRSRTVSTIQWPSTNTTSSRRRRSFPIKEILQQFRPGISPSVRLVLRQLKSIYFSSNQIDAAGTDFHGGQRRNAERTSVEAGRVFLTTTTGGAASCPQSSWSSSRQWWSFSLDGRFLASSERKGEIIIWSTEVSSEKM